MKNVKQLKNKHKPKEFLSDESFKKLITSLDKSYFSEHRDFAMIVLMFDTGMRLGECSRLVVSDLDLFGHRIYLREEETKGRKDRVGVFTESVFTRGVGGPIGGALAVGFLRVFHFLFLLGCFCFPHF